jgi:Flp pilus assembly protein TadG
MMCRARQKGVVAIELGLLLVPLTIILFGMIELGRGFYQYNTLVKSTHNAARYLSTQVRGVGIAQAKCMVVAGTLNTEACSTPILPGLGTAMVTVRYIDGVSTCSAGAVSGCGAINLVEVCVNCAEGTEKFQFTSMAGLFVSNITLGEIRAVMRREGA